MQRFNLIKNWKKFSFPPFVRNINAPSYFEDFLIAAVISILAIRFYLRLTGYPQLGGDGLHIAHMLWGGLLMMVAIVILLVFLSTTSKRFAAVIAGVGFGAFIDELGKFLTADNDYFFRPTFALIYVIFVILYLFFSFFLKNRDYSKTEYLINSLEAAKDLALNDLDTREKRQLVEWILHADPKDPLALAIKDLVEKVRPINSKRNIIVVVRQQVDRLYKLFTKEQWLEELTIAYLTFQFILSLITVVMVGAVSFSFSGIIINLNLGFFGWGQVFTLSLATLLSFLGLSQVFRNKRIVAYNLFRYSLFIDIYLVAFFAFYFNQLFAVLELFLSTLFLKTFEYGLIREGGGDHPFESWLRRSFGRIRTT